ncbi:hypothetical protein ANAEL_04673 [Anaerolineales bacterium]|nr:hypothetical protein ANAEL_04673 [Anaerolineales bacterium]
MTSGEKKRQTPVCPSCGQPVRFRLLNFKINDKVKILLILLAIGYFTLSLLIMVVISPRQTGLGKACRRYDYIHQPVWCKDTEFKLSVRPLNDIPALQVFVGVGLAVGILLLYWDWLQELYENWQRKPGKPVPKVVKTYKYTCRNCGREWN